MAENKQNKGPNVPPLRFPEFSEPWERKKLSCFLYENKERNKTDFFSKEDVLSVSGDLGIVNQIELLGRSFAGKSVKDYHVVRNGNIVYTKSPLKEYPYGIIKYNRGIDGIVSTLYAVYHVLDNADGRFIEFYFSDKGRINRYLKPIVRIGAKHDMKIGNEEVLDNYVVMPSLVEQDKIATFIELLNKRIAVQSKLIQQLESLIKGITLQASKSSDCESVLLSEILTERNELNTAQHEVCSVSVSQGVVNQVEYLGRSFAAKDISHYNVVHYGDIIYTKSPTGDFPYGIVKRSHQENLVAVSPLYGVYIPASNDIGCFLHYYFCNVISAKNYLHKLIQKGAKNTINITNQRFLENTINLPKTEKLAQVVALLNCLSAKKLQAENLLASLNKQKQFLLNQMFI